MKKKNYYTINNICICAGGLLFYDDNGIWVLREEKPFEKSFIDPGGKYQFEDTNINACIIREFHEETYYSYTELIHYSLFEELISKGLTEEVLFQSKNGWWYKCILIHTKHIFKNKSRDESNTFDNKKFFINRLNAIKHNQMYNFYISVEFLLLKYTDINNNWINFSERLKTILINSKINSSHEFK